MKSFDPRHIGEQERQIENLEALGQQILHSSEQPSQTEAELAERFGHEFSKRIADLEIGHWKGPIASVYGIHLVWVHERDAARLLDLDEVRDRVRYALLALRRADALERGLAVLREGTVVRFAEGE